MPALKRAGGVPIRPPAASNPPNAGAGAGHRIWTTSMLLDMIPKLTPQSSQIISVTIVGKPMSYLAGIYDFALRVAAGTLYGGRKPVESTPLNSTHFFESKIDYTSKTVTVVIGYEASGLQTAGGTRNVARLPLRDPITSGLPPAIITEIGGPDDSRIDPKPGTVVLQTKPGLNPGLEFERGTRDANNSIANAGRMIDPKKEVPKPAANDMLKVIEAVIPVFPGFSVPIIVPTGLDNKTKEALKKLFGFSE